MQVIYFLFALEKFQCLFELISVGFSTCVTFVYASFCIAFAENENDVNIFETIETRHFNISNYIKSVVGEVHLLNLINELLLFLYISLIFDISVFMGEKNKTCVTKTLFTNFTRLNCFLQVWKNLFIVLKIRSHAKLNLHFCKL